jgi:hypothetical protein
VLADQSERVIHPVIKGSVANQFKGYIGEKL